LSLSLTAQVCYVRAIHERRLEGRLLRRAILLRLQETSRCALHASPRVFVDQTKPAVRECYRKTAPPTALAPPLRPLSLFVSRAVAMTRSPCGHVCSPVLLRRLLLTQSNALQTQEQPPKLPIILGDPGLHLSLVPRAHTSPQPKQHLHRFSRFRTTHGCVHQTHTHRQVKSKR